MINAQLSIAPPTRQTLSQNRVQPKTYIYEQGIQYKVRTNFGHTPPGCGKRAALAADQHEDCLGLSFAQTQERLT